MVMENTNGAHYTHVLSTKSSPLPEIFQKILLVRSSNHHTFDAVPQLLLLDHSSPTQRSLTLALYVAAPSPSHC